MRRIADKCLVDDSSHYNLSGIRICHLGKYYPPVAGGIETYVQTLAQGQSRQGMSAKVVCVNHLEGPTTREIDGNVEVVRIRKNPAFRNFHLSWESRKTWMLRTSKEIS